MRILWILPFVPWPIKVRSFNLIPRLARRHEIDLVCVARTPSDFAHLDRMKNCCSSVRTGSYSLAGALTRSLLALPMGTPLRIAYVSSSSMRQAVREGIRDGQPDVIYVERWRALQYLPPENRVPVVCDPTDSMALYNYRLMRGGRFWERAVGLIEYLKFRRFEGRLAQRVAAAVFCSRTDLDFLRQLAPRSNLVQVANGVDCSVFARKHPDDEQQGDILFSGNFAYSPNRHAVRYFLKCIFPLVRRAVPQATFTIVGNHATAFMRGPDSSGVRVYDFTPKLHSHLARASVAIAPIQIGAGVSNKLLEAFAVGTPIVATTMACGDLPCRDGEHLFIADDAQLFADRIVRLLRDPTLRRTVAARARAFVERGYDWEIVARSMEDVLHKAAFGESRVVETPLAFDREAKESDPVAASASCGAS